MDTGLCFIHFGNGPKLGYRLQGGFGYKWLPHRIQRAIVRLWNRICCTIWGHDPLDYFRREDRIVCVNCSTRLPR